LLQPDRPLLPADDPLRPRRGGGFRGLVAEPEAGFRRGLRDSGWARGLAPPGSGADRGGAVPLCLGGSGVGEEGGARTSAPPSQDDGGGDRPDPRGLPAAGAGVAPADRGREAAGPERSRGDDRGRPDPSRRGSRGGARGPLLGGGPGGPRGALPPRP